MNGYNPYWVNPYQYPSADQIIDEMIRTFNNIRPTFSTDPATGNVLATKSIPQSRWNPNIPPAYQHLMGGGNLGATWVLPSDALTGPKMIERDRPSSALERQQAFSMGISNVGDRKSYLNPQTYWPSSAFKIPLRQSPTGMPEPMFGSTIDFTRGTVQTPYTQGAYSPVYTRFEPRYKTTPGYGNVPSLPQAIPFGSSRGEALRQYAWGGY